MKMTNQKLETALELALSVPSSVRAKSPSLKPAIHRKHSRGN